MMYQDRSTDDDSPLDGGRKRRRTKTNRYEFEFLDNEEQLMIQQALKISKMETKRVEMEIPQAPVFHPTLEEWKDPLVYIRKIRHQAEPYGICKIVPPAEWKPVCTLKFDNPKKFNTRRQPINTLQEGQGFDDGQPYTLSEYQKMANAFYQSWLDKHHHSVPPSLETLARDYWKIVETNCESVVVEYGNDIDTAKYGSGFPKPYQYEEDSKDNIKAEIENIQHREDFNDPFYYAKTSWNLNNIPSAPGSLLKYLKTPITGINVPWLYIGMLFSTFCWHTEDNYFYSVNYSHFGAAKQWYGVPRADAGKFEKVTKDFLMGLFRDSPDILHHMTTQVSPSLLARNGVHVYQTTHEAGTFIITFPCSYHAGFSYGFNVGEAVNFATMDWLPAGSEALERYRIFGRESVFSTQRLLFTVLKYKSEFHYDRKKLQQEVEKIINEEINGRKIALSNGVNELGEMATLHPNNFDIVDEKATEYDDRRVCALCKQTCLFTAVACVCDQNKVACLRHFPLLCKCPNSKKYLFAWGSDEELKQYIHQAAQKH